MATPHWMRALKRMFQSHVKQVEADLDGDANEALDRQGKTIAGLIQAAERLWKLDLAVKSDHSAKGEADGGNTARVTDTLTRRLEALLGRKRADPSDCDTDAD